MRQLMKKLHARSGETLLEVLVAILIVTVVIVALTQSVMISNRLNRQVKDAGLDQNFRYENVTYLQPNGMPVTGGIPSSTQVIADKSGILLSTQNEGRVYVQSIMDGMYYSFAGPRS